MPKIITKKEFIKKAIKIHENKYDYSKINYVNITTKIIIICPIHGEFKQNPNRHLQKQGCSKCFFERLKEKNNSNTKEFIEKARKVHGDKYDYSKVNYIKALKKIKIICPIHGEFLQVPSSHLQGYNCSFCGYDSKKIKKTKPLQQFINEAQKIHGTLYDYSKVNYIKALKKIKIICKEHGIFEQTPSSHIQGHGCIKCAYKNKGFNRRTTLEIFLKKAKQIHGDKYDYSKVNYINSDTKIEIICRKHDNFLQTPNSHLNGSGCPKCRFSKGEIKIENFLKQNKINFINQKKFKECKNKYLLKFDFYLPNYNLCIEYDGKQHFESIPLFGGKKSFKKQQKRDQIKNEFCWNNNINLIRLSYKDKDFILDKLQYTLNNIKVKPLGEK